MDGGRARPALRNADLPATSLDAAIGWAGSAATRKLADALREDRLYNNVLIADGATGDIVSSAVPLDQPANVRGLLAYQRARRTLDFATGAFLPEPGSPTT